MTTAPEGAPRRRRKAVPKSQPMKTVPTGDDIFKAAEHQRGFPKVPDMQRGFQTIVQDIFAEGYDVVQEWKDIRAAMVVSGALTPERLKVTANDQEDVSIRAHRLYVVAKVEVQAYMRETESIFGAIRESATQSLEKQKADKTRTKQITDPDVKAEAARLHPDEWAEICTRRDWAEGMLSQLLRLSESAKSRCFTITHMMAPGARGVS